MEAVDSSLTVMDHGDIIDARNNLDRVYLETAKEDDVSDVITSEVTRCTTITTDTGGTADAAHLTESRSVESDCAVDNTDPSDSDSTSDSTLLEAMTPDGQDYYLRLGDTPRQRSALRLSRIIARRQLLQRLEQGRNGENHCKAIVCS